MNELSESIKVEAKKLGFDLVRIIDAESAESFINEYKSQFEGWNERFSNDELSYLKNRKNERFKLNAYLDGVQSIICLSVNYYQIAKKEFSASKHYKISRYAWGRDYHKTITKKLKLLRRFIISKSENISEKNFKLSVDAGPVLEKLIAMRAGMGFIGKNSLLITPEFGSWVFLSEIFTTLELKSDPPRDDLGNCGDCSRCLDSCPIKAIEKPYSINPNKCISYLTIEHKGEITSDLSDKFNSWIFGCDICQEVCPHNQGKAKTTHNSDFINHKSGPYINKKEFEKMTRDEFDQIYSGSPLKRPGFDKLKSLDKQMKNP